MFRRVFTVLSGLSLLLCVAACALWVRSYWRGDSLNWGTPTGRAGVDSIQGRFIVGRVVVVPRELANTPRGWIFTSAPADEAVATMLRPNWEFATIQAARVRDRALTAEDVRVPHWHLALAAAVLPTWWWLRRRRDRRMRRLGHCLHCGYDLRATPGRCPECGAVSPAQDAHAPGNLDR